MIFSVNIFLNTATLLFTGYADEEISSLQCLMSVEGDRTGLLLGRRNGAVELWDERWPSSPAVVFHGSRVAPHPGAHSSPAAHAPSPVVEQPGNSFIASPLLLGDRVGVWEVSSGRLLNVLEVPDADSEPPCLILRSQWGRSPLESSFPLRGPALLALTRSHAHWYYS